jgi:hypothetical protein
MRWLSRLTTLVVVVTVVVAVAMLIRSAMPDTAVGGSFWDLREVSRCVAAAGRLARHRSPAFASATSPG